MSVHSANINGTIMAQTIHLPILFDFRKVKVEWDEVVGRIVGWESPPDLAMQVKINGHETHITYSRHHLPYKLQLDCEGVLVNGSAIDQQSGNFLDEVAEDLCADFRPTVFASWQQPYIRDFEDMRNKGELARWSLGGDGWQLRDAFLRVTPEPKHILKFLNHWGRWNADKYVRLEDFADLQRTVRKALLSPAEEWFNNISDNLDSLWDRRTEPPYFAVETFECELAIRMTVTIDLLRSADFKLCARKDCSQPFQITSAHKRRYCTQYCGHLQSIRKSRKKNKARARTDRASTR